VAWVEIPADAVLERPRAFLAGIIPLGLVVVLVGAGVGGVLSQRSTAALLNSEERFRTLAAMAPDAIIAAGEDSRMTYVNPGAERIFGYTADKMLGQALTMLMPERFHDAHLGGVQRWVTTGEGRVIGRTVELTGLRADGSEFPLELSLAARWVDDRPRVIGIIRDVTERKRRDEELRRYSAELEVANEELEAFSYSVAHDLRAPLRAIHGFSQALLEDCHDGLDESGNHYLRRVCAAAERMALLIDDLLELSRATRAEMHRTRIDLSALAERAAADLAETAPERKVDVRIAPGLTALGDHKLLALVMGNLVGNAWKFTSAKDQAVIEVGHSAADDSDAGRAAFFVRDDGAGFDQTHADKLFSPFQRLHSRRDFDGNGVGLALVERIIRRHGGSVWGEGAEGEGATFYFTLPDP
jgi:PAS domain S-box-containing protein